MVIIPVGIKEGAAERKAREAIRGGS